MTNIASQTTFTQDRFSPESIAPLHPTPNMSSIGTTLDGEKMSANDQSPTSSIHDIDEAIPKSLEAGGLGSSNIDFEKSGLNHASTTAVGGDEEEATIEEQMQSQPPADPKIVTWNGPDDPENPKNFTWFRKWLIVVSTAVMTFWVSLASSIFSSTVNVTAREFGVSSEVMLLGVALFVVGFAFGKSRIQTLSILLL